METLGELLLCLMIAGGFCAAIAIGYGAFLMLLAVCPPLRRVVDRFLNECQEE